MQRVVIDTNIYIDWLNEGRHEDIIFRRDAVKHLSAVVLMELLAGAFSVQDRRLVRDITLSFAKTNRIVTPTVSGLSGGRRCIKTASTCARLLYVQCLWACERCADYAIGPLDWRECDHSKRT
jgi:hypothetical protein